MMLKRLLRSRLCRDNVSHSAVLAASIDAIIEVNAEERVVEFNSRAEELFSYTRTEILGQPWTMLGVELEKRANPFERGDQPTQSEGTAVRRDGTTFDIRLSSATRGTGKDTIHVIVLHDLTSTNLTRSELKRSEERYRAFIQQSYKGIWRAELERPIPVDLPIEDQVERIITSAKFAEYNQSLIRIFGYPTPDALVGKGITTVLPATGDRGRDFLRMFIRANYHLSDVEADHQDLLGNPRFLLDSLVGIIVDRKLTLIWGTHRDVTAQRETEQALKLRSHVLENLTEGVAITTEDGTIIYTNPTEDSIFGSRRGEFLGQNLSKRYGGLREEARSTFFGILEHVKQYGSWRGEVLNQRKDRSSFISYSRVTSILLGGSRFFVWVQEDVTEKKRLFEAERVAREEAERAGRLKDQFLATLSHELRTPLNAILGWTQLCRPTTTATVDLNRGLDVIERNARIQTQIIDDLLDMNRIISGKLRLDLESTDLTKVIEDSIESVRPAANAKEIKLRVILPSVLKPVLVDPERLQQVLWNLLSNAVKFTDAGGRVEVIARFSEREVELSVVDTGEGIEQEFLPYVFDRFRQADASMARRHGGLGLGLAIARQLVELHGGRIEATSAGRGRGTTFTVTLPLVATHYGQRLSLKETPAPFEQQQTLLRGRKILVVDDQPDAQELVKRLLEECGAEVATASSAEEGLELLKSKQPEVLISDIGMPELDGIEFMRRVRELPQWQGGKVAAVALTAFARAEDKILALEAGYQMHLSKPVEPAELVQVVSDVLEARA